MDLFLKRRNLKDWLFSWAECGCVLWILRAGLFTGSRGLGLRVLGLEHHGNRVTSQALPREQVLRERATEKEKAGGLGQDHPKEEPA